MPPTKPDVRLDNGLEALALAGNGDIGNAERTSDTYTEAAAALAFLLAAVTPASQSSSGNLVRWKQHDRWYFTNSLEHPPRLMQQITVGRAGDHAKNVFLPVDTWRTDPPFALVSFPKIEHFEALRIDAPPLLRKVAQSLHGQWVAIQRVWDELGETVKALDEQSTIAHLPNITRQQILQTAIASDEYDIPNDLSTDVEMLGSGPKPPPAKDASEILETASMLRQLHDANAAVMPLLMQTILNIAEPHLNRARHGAQFAVGQQTYTVQAPTGDDGPKTLQSSGGHAPFAIDPQLALTATDRFAPAYPPADATQLLDFVLLDLPKLLDAMRTVEKYERPDPSSDDRAEARIAFAMQALISGPHLER